MTVGKTIESPTPQSYALSARGAFERMPVERWLRVESGRLGRINNSKQACRERDSVGVYPQVNHTACMAPSVSEAAL